MKHKSMNMKPVQQRV